MIDPMYFRKQQGELSSMVDFFDKLGSNDVRDLGKVCRYNGQDLSLPANRRKVWRSLATLIKGLK